MSKVIAVLFGLCCCNVKAQELYLRPRQYVLEQTQTTWSEAESACLKKGGTLATIYDIATVPDLNLKEDLGFTGELFWIGLQTASSLPNSSWTWGTGGDVAAWFNWSLDSAGFINDSNGGHICVAASVSTPYVWYKLSCQRMLPYICQFNKDGSCWFESFENMHIAVHNYVYLYQKSPEECMTYCTIELEHNCHSFDYFPGDGRCLMNTGNMWSVPSYYRESAGWVYYHRTCNSGKIALDFTTPTYSISPTPTLRSDVPSSFPSCYETSNVILSSYLTLTHDVTYSHNVTITHNVTRTDLITETQTVWHSTTVQVVETSTKIFIHTPVFTFQSTANDSDPEQELIEIGENARKKQKKLKKISVPDNRPSAKYVGYVAIMFISLVLGAVVSFDLITVFRNVSCHKGKGIKVRKDRNRLEQQVNRTKVSVNRGRQVTVALENDKTKEENKSEAPDQTGLTLDIDWTKIKANQDKKKHKLLARWRDLQTDDDLIVDGDLNHDRDLVNSWHTGNADTNDSVDASLKQANLQNQCSVQLHWRPLVWSVDQEECSYDKISKDTNSIHCADTSYERSVSDYFEFETPDTVYTHCDLTVDNEKTVTSL